MCVVPPQRAHVLGNGETQMKTARLARLLIALPIIAAAAVGFAAPASADDPNASFGLDSNDIEVSVGDHVEQSLWFILYAEGTGTAYNTVITIDLSEVDGLAAVVPT